MNNNDKMYLLEEFIIGIVNNHHFCSDDLDILINLINTILDKIDGNKKVSKLPEDKLKQQIIIQKLLRELRFTKN